MYENIWRYGEKQGHIKNMYGNIQKYSKCVWSYKEIQGTCMETYGNIGTCVDILGICMDIYRSMTDMSGKIKNYMEYVWTYKGLYGICMEIYGIRMEICGYIRNTMRKEWNI